MGREHGPILILLGLILVILASSLQSDRESEYGGIVFIGPIPIVFGSDPRTALQLIFVAIALMLLWIVANL